MLHLANGGDNGLYRWWFDNITSRGVPFDVIGASYYGYWHGSLGDLQRNLNDVSARYGKDVVVVETAYPFTLADDDGWPNIIGLPGQLVAGYPATPEGQAANFRDVMSIVRAVPNGRGLGRLLLGCHVDGRSRKRLGSERSVVGQRLGEPGALRLRATVPLPAMDELSAASRR